MKYIKPFRLNEGKDYNVSVNEISEYFYELLDSGYTLEAVTIQEPFMALDPNGLLKTKSRVPSLKHDYRASMFTLHKKEKSSGVLGSITELSNDMEMFDTAVSNMSGDNTDFILVSTFMNIFTSDVNEMSLSLNVARKMHYNLHSEIVSEFLHEIKRKLENKVFSSIPPEFFNDIKFDIANDDIIIRFNANIGQAIISEILNAAVEKRYEFEDMEKSDNEIVIKGVTKKD
jgi:hypothetical protein